MDENIVEYYRKKCIEQLFKAKGFETNWQTWKPYINQLVPKRTPKQILDLGDSLRKTFYTTNKGTREQGDVSGGGASWESLVCWYLNLCLIGRRTVVVKHSKQLLPIPVSDAITVNYSNFVSNTESDLIAITFPDNSDYSIDKNLIDILDSDEEKVKLTKGRKGTYNLLDVLNALCHRDFEKLEIHVIQCKTNWNDNAQIPMLWDMIYSAEDFKNNIKVGKNNYSMHEVAKFTYSFVTVPTIKLEKIKSTSTCVQRVRNISGGNYWGRQSESNIASSIKEMLGRNLKTGHVDSHLLTLKKELPKLANKYDYFNLS
ncbi:hypothetical protein CBE01nite_41120 [Clostridium beijerinckii]|uniref:Uncharacterized protein n=1 Tax=Clostridium beijerinckii TaxID=1520 RepID=A0AB74VFD9_CLOBE|nr:hypothetical protein [Clostridium beijerinckii]NRZ29427.1 hypothetical protein [Clostridium beijerinckii]NYB94803.1 hypothetical protein [Clostridium beijerinckii]OOM28039.1 hypothetical protein CLBEI_00150 [Clostridium beijerinckii]QUN35060.1 hypothetical protein KEC93_24595 [Clostridium beijerinckii]SQA99951.1 Uncharacterised protein [Clostridium beijerinckii]